MGANLFHHLVRLPLIDPALIVLNERQATPPRLV
jgi:hypothetical protein